MGMKLKTAPSEYPVTLDEAKAHLSILSADDDVLIQFLIEVATAQAEDITNRQLMSAVHEMTLDTLPERFELKKPPLISVDKIEYIPDGLENYALLDPSLYSVSDYSEPARIVKKPNISYPSIATVVDPVRVTFTAGYADAASVPKPIKQWMLIRIATLFEHREEVVVGVSVSPIVNEYNDYLISKYRVITL